MDQAEGLRNIVKQQDKPKSQNAARVITVTSGKGGVGKSSVSVNLAIQFTRMGKRVIVLDADFGLANIEIMLGVRPQHNFADLMFRGKNLADIITYGPENIGFISGGSGINEMSNLTKEQVVSLISKLNELDKLPDIIIVDTGAGIGDAVMEFVSASEEVLLVATPEPTSITDAYALLKSLNRNSSYMPEKTVVKMIANQVRSDKDADELFEKIGIIVNKFLNIDIEYLGPIPYDANMSKAVIRQEPLSLAYPNSNVVKAMKKIVAKLENVESKDDEKGIMRLFSRVIKLKLQH